ncbi:MAG TPA: NUDIX hydrolase [Actinophytocola sp.]|uniref:NUDIX hydrolase n=1 Tax=Actinophytocola sp. TaxID=1872138 RepID=UPI002F93C384
MVDPGWARLASEERFASAWFTVWRDRARRPDGSVTDYDHVVAPAAVTVLAADGAGLVAVTRQWIYVHRERQWRLPAGRVESSENVDEAARRELREETGISAESWTALGVINCADSLTNHRDHAFLATGLTGGTQRLDAGEADLEVHWMPFARVVDLVLGGEMPHAGSSFAVLAAKVKGLLE